MNQVAFDDQNMSLATTYAADDRLWVEFYVRPVQNNAKSNAEGRPIFDEVEYVRIVVPGDRNTTVDTPVTEEHRQRFAKRYERFKKGAETVQDGTPLEAVTWLTVGQVAELKAMNIHTVDALAITSDQNAKFMGAHELRRKAQAFLDASKDAAATTRLTAELEKRDNEIAALKAQMEEIAKAQKAAADKK